MKKAIYFLTLAISAAFVLTSCDPKEGDDRDAFVATWNIDEEFTITGWGTGTDEYEIDITKSSSVSNGILISNFAGVEFVVDATVNGSSMTISDNITDEGETYSVSGSGTVSGSSLNFNYNIGGFWTGECDGIKIAR